MRVAVAVASYVLCSSAAASAQNATEMQLSAAARECRPQEVADLLAQGVDLNSVNSGGWTPLMMAASYGCDEAARLLLEKGADVTVKHADFGDAAALAKANRYPKILAMIEGASKASPAGAVVQQQASTAPAGRVTPSSPVLQRGTGTAGWPKLGHYKVGQQVLYSGTGGKTWGPAVIKSIDPKYGYNLEGVTGSEDAFFVVGTEREPFWTGWFVGDWRVSVPMAMGTVTDGKHIYRTVSGGMRLPPLRINADGSYTWRVQQGGAEKLIRGRWTPSPAGPGVVLKNGEQGSDWLVYNNSRTGSTSGETIILSSECCSHYDGSRLK